MIHDRTGDAPNNAPKTLGLQGWGRELQAIKNRLRGRFFGAFRRFRHCLKTKYGARDGTKPKAKGGVDTGLCRFCFLVTSLKTSLKQKAPPSGLAIGRSAGRSLRANLSANYLVMPSTQNADFGDTQKRLPPSFGLSLGPDFLPSPLACAFGAGFHGRECTRRTCSRISASPGSVGLAAGHGARCGGALEGRKIVGYRAAQRLPRGGGCRPGAPALGSSRGLVLCG